MFTTVLAQAGDLDGVLVTADALHAQRDHATWLHDHGAHYLVKGNQPGLLGQLRSLPWKQVPAGHVQEGKGYGRAEKHTVKAVSVAAGLEFPHAAADTCWAPTTSSRIEAKPGRSVSFTSLRIPRLPLAVPRDDHSSDCL